jgi:hypothetical protein
VINSREEQVNTPDSVHFTSESDSNEIHESSAQPENHEKARNRTFRGILIKFREDDERANSESVSDESDLHECAVRSEMTNNCDRSHNMINDGVTTSLAIVTAGREAKPRRHSPPFLQQVSPMNA